MNDEVGCGATVDGLRGDAANIQLKHTATTNEGYDLRAACCWCGWRTAY